MEVTTYKGKRIGQVITLRENITWNGTKFSAGQRGKIKRFCPYVISVGKNAYFASVEFENGRCSCDLDQIF